MKRILLQWDLVSVLTTRPWDGPHLQRLAERWLRRWGFALTGLALGVMGMWLSRPEVSQEHALAAQAVARLEQQLANLPLGAAAQSPAPLPVTPGISATQPQRLLARLPAWSQPEQVWTTWQQALAAHGLRLQYLQPMPPSASEMRSGALVSHLAAWRVLGRFDDWVKVWAACAESGPVCTIERIHVVATNQPTLVQIDAVMRVWTRPAEKRSADGVDPVAAHSPDSDVQAHWMTDAGAGLQPSGRSRTSLFAPAHGAAGDTAGRSLADSDTPTTNAEGASAAVASLVVLPDDPHQWPYARVRLAGLWHQGGERHAVLSAGPHTVRVMPGQRVTREGHRVAAITDVGVDLRLGQGPLLQLAWADALQVGALAAPSAGPGIDASSIASTTGSPPK